MIYAVIPLDKDVPELEDRVTAVHAGAYTTYKPRAYFVSFAGTTGALFEKLRLDELSGSRDVVILPVTNYTGWGNQDLWDWMETEDGK